MFADGFQNVAADASMTWASKPFLYFFPSIFLLFLLLSFFNFISIALVRAQRVTFPRFPTKSLEKPERPEPLIIDVSNCVPLRSANSIIRPDNSIINNRFTTLSNNYFEKSWEASSLNRIRIYLFQSLSNPKTYHLNHFPFKTLENWGRHRYPRSFDDSFPPAAVESRKSRGIRGTKGEEVVEEKTAMAG